MSYKYLGEHYVVVSSWAESPHLSEDAKASLLGSIPAWQRDARSKGIPQLGEGAIWTVGEDQFVVPPIRGGIPSTWPRVYALDVGVRVTAAVWMARDPDTGVHYVYMDYDREDAPYSIHAAEIKSKGEWIAGCVDPAADQRTIADGERTIDNYRRAGLILTEAENSVNSGIDDTLDALISGKLKVIETCQKLIRQMRTYRRERKNEIVRVVKKNDHLCDCLRYVWVTGRNMMKVKPQKQETRGTKVSASPRAWMA